MTDIIVMVLVSISFLGCALGFLRNASIIQGSQDRIELLEGKLLYVKELAEANKTILKGVNR